MQRADLVQASERFLTMEALVLKRSSRVMPREREGGREGEREREREGE